MVFDALGMLNGFNIQFTGGYGSIFSPISSTKMADCILTMTQICGSPSDLSHSQRRQVSFGALSEETFDSQTVFQARVAQALRPLAAVKSSPPFHNERFHFRSNKFP